MYFINKTNIFKWKMWDLWATNLCRDDKVKCSSTVIKKQDLKQMTAILCIIAANEIWQKFSPQRKLDSFRGY